MVNAGIFGPKLSGKTTLARAISLEHWRKFKMRSLILDPHCEPWGQHAFVTPDENLFWPNVWKTNNCLIVVEEAASTIKREKSLIPIFTRLRHNHHKLIVVGHSGVSLLPVMREQIDTIYLFRQCRDAAECWARVMTEDGLLDAVNLRQYEFIFHQLYGSPRKLKLQI